MQVRCPYCSSVFEADRAGIRFCPSCGKQIQIPEGALAPSAAAGGAPPSGPAPTSPSGSGGAPSSAAAPTAREPTPWERRGELGVLKALVETWRRSIFMPEPFWSSVKPDGPAGDAFAYALIIWAAAAVIQFPIQAFRATQSQRILEQMAGGQFGNMPAEFQRWFDILARYQMHPFRTAVFYIGAYLVLAPIGLLIGSAIVHLFCMLLGCAKNGYWATFRTFAYASAPAVAVGIPCVGAVAGIYMIVLEIWGLARIQETTIGKAAGAVLLPVVVVWCCGCLAIFGLGAFIASLLHLNG